MNYLVVLLVLIGNLSHLSAENANANSDTTKNGSGPLFLTSLIKDNKIAEARKLSSVKPLAGCGASYAGLLTINETYDSNLFFWFFPCECNAESAPVVVWSAGAQSSCLLAAFADVGPYRVIDNCTVGLLDNSWTNSVSVLFIDNLLGVGYSFTNSSQGYFKNEADVGRGMYAALVQFYAMFPEFLKNELFVVGASYGAKHAVALAFEIYLRELNVERPKMNLKGVMTLDGFCDPMRQLKYADYLYQLGLVDARGRDAFKKGEDAAVAYIQQEKYAEAAYEIAALILSGNSSLFTKLTGFEDVGAANIVRPYNPILDVVTQFVQTTFIRNAVHVGNLTFASGVEAQAALDDFAVSVVPQIQTLVEKYKFVFVGGQLDAIVPFTGWENVVAHLKWSGTRQYRNATRQVWKVNGDVVGYVKSANDSRVMLALVRDAGHVVSVDQHFNVYELLRNLTSGESLDLTDVIYE